MLQTIQSLFIFFQVEAEEFEYDYCLSSIDILPKIQQLAGVLGSQMPDQNLGNEKCT